MKKKNKNTDDRKRQRQNKSVCSAQQQPCKQAFKMNHLNRHSVSEVKGNHNITMEAKGCYIIIMLI